MKLHIIGTGSAGNSYLLAANSGQTLLLECGVRFKFIQEALKFDYSNVTALITHSHQDHCKSAKDVAFFGIDIYCLKDTSDTFPFKSHRLHEITPGKQIVIGDFKIVPFKVKHDVPCLGFLIQHEECGKVLFLTDTYMVEQSFTGLNNIIIEANFSEDLLDLPKYRSDRLIQSHMSLDTCKGVLMANDLKSVFQIVLIHLSDTNSDAERFKREIKELTRKTVHVGYNGMSIDFNKTPF